MWRSPLGQQQLHEELHATMLPGTPASVKRHSSSWAGSFVRVKKLFVLLLLLVAFGVFVYRLLTTSQGPGARQHGTPDHWPPVVRKPGTESAPAA